MKIVTLLGSPRANGNTATLANIFNKTAEMSGADIQTFMLNKMNFRGCQHCDACKTKTDRCVLKDDLTEVLEAVRHTDVLVLSTPIYFVDITAQLKTFVDRCYSFLEPYEGIPAASRISGDKKLVLITAQNRPDEDHADICMKYRMIFDFMGFKESHLIRGCELLKADALNTKHRQDLIDLAKQTAIEVVAPGRS